MGRQQHEYGLDRVPLVNRERTAQVYESGHVYTTGDAQRDPEISRGVKETLGVQSMIAVPLRVNGGIHGVLVAMSSAPNRFSDEDERFFVTVARWVGMIASRIELTEAIRQNTAAEARQPTAEEVIAVLAHDVGNAFTPLRGHLDLLGRTLSQDGREQELEHVIQATCSVDSIHRLVTDLLDISRLDPGLFRLNRQPLNLAELVEEVAEERCPSADALV